MTVLPPNRNEYQRYLFQKMLNATLEEPWTYEYGWQRSGDCQYTITRRYSRMTDFEKEEIWINGVLRVIFGVVGVLGNFFTFVVLCQPKMRKITFYNLLLVLACFDTLFILTYGLATAYRSLAEFLGCVDSLNSPMIFELGKLNGHFLVGSIYMTVAISLERYLGICHPTLQFSRRSLVFILPVVFLSITYDFLVSLVWSYSAIPVDFTSKESYIEIIRANKNRAISRIWTKTIFQSTLPPIALLLLNGFIIATVKRSMNIPRTHSRQEGNTIKILFSIVLIFFILHLPRVVNNILYVKTIDGAPHWMIPIESLALVINSSINFVIYSLVGRNFKAELVRVLKYKNAHVLNTSSSGDIEVLSLSRLFEI